MIRFRTPLILLAATAFVVAAASTPGQAPTSKAYLLNVSKGETFTEIGSDDKTRPAWPVAFVSMARYTDLFTYVGGCAMRTALLAILLAAPPELGDLEGQVVDSKGKPVSGAKVVRADTGLRVKATTDADGNFKLKHGSAPGFLFVQKDTFRFHGQRADGAGKLRIVLTRRDEPAVKTVLPKAKDDDRMRLLAKVASVDPGKALEELENRPLKSEWYDGYIRRAAVKALAQTDAEEARTVADSIKEAGFRAHCYLDLHDALPATKTADRLTCLNRALVASQAVTGNDHKLYYLGHIGRRLHELGEKERATKLLRQGEAIARELPTAGFAGYTRGAFAEELALIDLPSALALMKDLKDANEHLRHHGNLAQRLGGVNPAEAERVLNQAGKPGDSNRQYQVDQYAVRVCHRMAPADLARARKIAGSIKEESFRARALAVMALALAKSKPKEALGLLDEAFTILAKKADSGVDRFNNYWDAAGLAGLSVRVAEQIDPALVPEFLWRALSFLPSRYKDGPRDPAGNHVGSVGTLALTLSRYDRKLALDLLDTAGAPPRENIYGAVNLFRVAALVDPDRAVAMLKKLPPGREADYMRDAVVTALLAEGEARERLIHHALAQWYIDDEDL
jgi:hypothetical protein